MFKFLFFVILVFLVFSIFFSLKKMGLVLGDLGKRGNVLSEGEEEKLVLVTVRKRKGVVTPLDVVADSSLSLEKVREILDKFVSQAYADIKVSEDGFITYEFPSFMKED